MCVCAQRQWEEKQEREGGKKGSRRGTRGRGGGGGVGMDEAITWLCEIVGGER